MDVNKCSLLVGKQQESMVDFEDKVGISGLL